MTLMSSLSLQMMDELNECSRLMVENLEKEVTMDNEFDIRK